MKILIIDDHKETVRDFSSLLRRRIDAEIIVAHTGDEAVSKAISEKPDIVLLDVMLPVMNGFEVMDQLKAHRFETRVIMISGVFNDIKSVVRCIRAGACDFYSKPVDADEIVEGIRRHFALESALNLSVINSPRGILKLLERSDDFAGEVREEVARLRAEDSEKNRIREDERLHQREIERHQTASRLTLLEAATKAFYVLAVSFVVWAMHRLQILPPGGGNIVFFLSLIVLLFIPHERIRNVAASLPGVKANIKVDPASNAPTQTDQA